MSNGRECEYCGAYGDPPPCPDRKACERAEERENDFEARLSALEERVEALEGES